MEDKKEIIKSAKAVITEEAEAIIRLSESLDESFTDSVELIYNCHGRVIITGMGKSGIIGKKIAATLASTGTPAYFLHPAEGIHGDLGMVLAEDIVVLLSRSGDTKEINDLIPSFKAMGTKLIAITSRTDSILAKHSDVVLDIKVDKEAGHLGLAPTTSTTVSLVLGDALAIALLKRRDFKPEDFAFYHPGGMLGKQLLLKVEELMHSGSFIPMVTKNCGMKEVLCEMTSKRLGMTTVLDDQGILLGIITDGDLRRILEKDESILGSTAEKMMSLNPKTIEKNKLAAEALKIMEDYSITSLVICDENKKPEGIIHIHDIIRAGIKQ